MKVLYLSGKAEYETELKKSFERLQIQVTVYSLPKNTGKEVFAMEIATWMEKEKPDFIFSLDYLPVISMVCETMKVKYVSWIVSNYEPGIYSCTLLNECNYIFFSDYFMYQQFCSEDFRNIFFMPLGAFQSCIDAKREDSIEYEYDLAMLQNIIKREDMKLMPLSMDSQLKDSTKGYLEGCIACQYQIRGLPSVTEKLPGYVREDLETHFPASIENDSVETPEHYYDYKYFNPLITYSERDIFFHEFQENEYFKKCIQQCNLNTEEFVRLVQRSKVNLVITHRNQRSGIPQAAWNIMGAGGFLLSNLQGDYLHIFSSNPPVCYRSEIDMLSKGIYYLNHETERMKKQKEISDLVREEHGIQKRLQAIISRMQE